MAQHGDAELEEPEEAVEDEVDSRAMLVDCPSSRARLKPMVYHSLT